MAAISQYRARLAAGPRAHGETLRALYGSFIRRFPQVELWPRPSATRIWDRGDQFTCGLCRR
jgi:hypothetical protein